MARDLSIGGLRERRLACVEERERERAGIDAADRFLLLHVRLIAAQSVAYQLEHAPSRLPPIFPNWWLDPEGNLYH